MSTPAVSVVMPAYNHEAFVGEAVASVLEGPWTDLELVVVDDGSADRTADVVAARSDDDRLVLLRQSNRGAHAALNRGLETARGELVLILDSDDAFVPERIGKCVDRLRSDPGISVVSSWLEVVDAGGASLGVKHGWADLPPWPAPAPGPHLSDLGDPRLAMLETNFVATTSNLAFRRSLVTRHGLRFRDLRYCHDWDFLLAACALGRLALLEEPLVRYRVHGGNTIREGEAEAAGQGAMRFEILSTVVRHTPSVLAAAGGDRRDLERRWWRSAPRFDRPDLLAALLATRGGDPAPPASYDRLTSTDHPFRRAAQRALSAAEP